MLYREANRIRNQSYIPYQEAVRRAQIAIQSKKDSAPLPPKTLSSQQQQLSVPSCNPTTFVSGFDSTVPSHPPAIHPSRPHSDKVIPPSRLPSDKAKPAPSKPSYRDAVVRSTIPQSLRTNNTQPPPSIFSAEEVLSVPFHSQPLSSLSNDPPVPPSETLESLKVFMIRDIRKQVDSLILAINKGKNSDILTAILHFNQLIVSLLIPLLSPSDPHPNN